MIRSRAGFVVASLVVCVLLVGGTLFSAAARRDEPAPDSLYKYLSVFTEVLGLVQQAYVEETEVETLVAGAFEGAIDALDPFSAYVPEAEVAAYVAAGFEPVPSSGIVLIKERGWLYVVGVVEGSEAHRLGVERGDLLSRIDGEDSRMQPVWKIQGRLAQAAGRPVAIEIIRRGETLDIELGAATEPLPSPVVRTDEGEVSIVRISRFDGTTAGAVEEALSAIASEGRAAVLVDLRGVAAGDPSAAIAVADLFVDGELGRLVRKGETAEVFSDARAALFAGRVGVAVDRGTLGAAEVLASALDRSLDAPVVGEPTFGYAGRQREIQLSSGALLRLTDAFYAGPEGEPITSPLEPDVRVTERMRRLSDRDVTLDELILQRGVEELSGEAELDAAA